VIVVLAGAAAGTVRATVASMAAVRTASVRRVTRRDLRVGVRNSAGPAGGQTTRARSVRTLLGRRVTRRCPIGEHFVNVRVEVNIT
jgi:hypothetical protein